MAAVVDVCLEKILKLRAKVRAQNPLLRAAANEVEERKQRMQDSTSSSATLKSPANALREETMSEETVFWLMDRFAPC